MLKVPFKMALSEFSYFPNKNHQKPLGNVVDQDDSEGFYSAQTHRNSVNKEGYIAKLKLRQGKQPGTKIKAATKSESN